MTFRDNGFKGNITGANPAAILEQRGCLNVRAL